MRVLLDTHAFVWFIAGSPNLSPSARALVEDPTNDKVVSAAGLWELAIKVSIGRLHLAAPFEVLIPDQIKRNGFEVLGVEVRHTAVVVSLPFHHRDPFDGLLVAQALAEGMPIISADSALDAYAITRLW